MIVNPHMDLAPYLPDVGELYWIDSALLDPDDGQARRPGFVVSVPADLDGRITVVVPVRGLADTARPDVEALVVSAYVRTVEARLWAPELVTYLDRIEPRLVGTLLTELGL